MLEFKTSCAVLAYLSSNLLNEVGLSLFRYFEVGERVCDIVVKKFTFAISSPDEFLFCLSRDCSMRWIKQDTYASFLAHDKYRAQLSAQCRPMCLRPILRVLAAESVLYTRRTPVISL